MSHLTPAEIVALRDGATDILPDHRARHLDGCVPCREALAAARVRSRRIEASLPAAPPLPEERLRSAREAVRTRLGSEARAPGRAPGRAPEDAARRVEAPPAHPPGTRRHGWSGLGSLSRAAGLLLILAGGAAALPGSPVREWIRSTLAEPTVAPRAAEGVDAEAPEAAETGVRLRVEEGPVTVAVDGAGAGARIEVVRAEGFELAVFAPDGSRFASGEGRVSVSAAAGPVRVQLPAALPATLTVDGRVYLLWTRDGPEIRGPVTERSDDRIVFEVEG